MSVFSRLAPARPSDLADLRQLASRSTWLALGTLLLSLVAIVLFFGGAGFLFGPINDVLVALTLVLLVPAILAVRLLAGGRAGSWFSVLSAVAIAGMIGAAVGQLLLVVGVIDLQTSFLTGGIGVLPFVVWIGAQSYLALRRDVLSRRVGWWGAAFVGLSTVTAVAIPLLPPALLYAMGLPLAVTLSGWLISLARDL